MWFRCQSIHVASALRRNIEKDIRSDLSGDLEKFIVALLQGVREQGVDRSAAEADADELYAAGEECVSIKVLLSFSHRY